VGEELRVIATRPLNVRRSGHKDAEIVAQLPTDTILDTVGKPNVNNYAEVVVNGWLEKDGKTVVADSMEASQPGVKVDAVLFVASAWKASAAVDEYGRIPGAVRGWVWLGYTEPVKPDKELIDQ
jgi:hypothetical protein